MFDLRLDDVIKWICDRGYSSVAIQLPEGLKVRATEISDFLYGRTGIDVSVIGSPCYGACDIFTDFRRYSDALVHFGHSPIPSQEADPDIMYVEAEASPDISDAVRSAASELPLRVGLLATVQYVNLIPEARRILESCGREVLVGMGDSRIFHPGQVLGCNCSSALSVEDAVDAFLFLGEGDFHPLAATFGTSKPVVILNPMTGETRTVDDVRDRILRKRFAAIETARQADSFLVIVCGKVGQNRSSAADAVIGKVRAAGKKAYRVVLEEVTPDALLPYQVDAYVNTACPRIALDDSVRYRKPMLTVPEAEIALGLRDWEDYRFDSI